MGTDPEARNCALIFFVGKECDIIFLGKFGLKKGISSKDGMPIHVTDFPEPISDIIMLKFIFRLRLKKSDVVHTDGGDFCSSQISPKPIDLISSSTWVRQLVCPSMFNRYKSPHTSLSGLLAGKVISFSQ